MQKMRCHSFVIKLQVVLLAQYFFAGKKFMACTYEYESVFDVTSNILSKHIFLLSF